MSIKSREFTFNVTSPAKLKLGNISGSVVIEPGDDGIIHVLAIKQPEHGDYEKTKIECSQAEDGSVSISTKYSSEGWSFLFGAQVSDVDYVVKAPRHCSLNISGVSNSLKVTGFEGEFIFKTVSGDMTIQSLIGTLKLDSVSGDISGENLSGPCQINSVSGDINLRDSNLVSANIKTVSGDVRLQTKLSEGPFRFKTVSGDIHLLVPASSSCNVEMNSISGDFSTNLPVSHSTHSHGNHSARVGKGGVDVTLKSVSGDLMVESDGEIPVTTEIVPLEILSKVESGELSVEEALTQLNG